MRVLSRPLTLVWVPEATTLIVRLASGFHVSDEKVANLWPPWSLVLVSAFLSAPGLLFLCLLCLGESLAQPLLQLSTLAIGW